MSSGNATHIQAMHDRLDAVVAAGSSVSEAFRTLGRTLERWREETPGRQRQVTLLTKPSVTEADLIEQQNDAQVQYQKLCEALEAAESKVDGLAIAIGDRLGKPLAFEVELRGLLRKAEAALSDAWGVVFLAGESLAISVSKKDGGVWGRALEHAYRELSEVVFGDIKEATGQLADMASAGASAGNNDNPPTRYTTGTLAKAIGVSDETIRNAAKAAGFKPKERGTREEWIGPREASMIATARCDSSNGFRLKTGERDAWERLLAQIGAPEIGSKTQARSKAHPKTTR